MKFRVYLLSKNKNICLETNESFNANEKMETPDTKLETDSLTEALAKVEELKETNEGFEFHNLLDKDTDWDSVEMDEARKEAEKDKENKENKDEKAKE